MKWAQFGNGSHGVMKDEARAMHLEPLMYQVGKRLDVNVPTTVTRNFGGKTYSVQRAVDGQMPYHFGNVTHLVRDNPDFHKMALFDWLTGNTDRHDENYLIHDKDQGQHNIHAIDHNFGFKYFKDNEEGQLDPLFNAHDLHGIQSQHRHINNNLRRINPAAPIPANFKEKLNSTSNGDFAQVLKSYLSHPNAQGYLDKVYTSVPHDQVRRELQNHFLTRLTQLRNHLNDPSVQSFGDLTPRITGQQAMYDI